VKRPFFYLPLAGFLFGICTADTVGAEPITVTSGALNVAWDDPSGFGVFGVDGFRPRSIDWAYTRRAQRVQGTAGLNLPQRAGGLTAHASTMEVWARPM
jgi:hypothetical protein